MTAPPSPAPPYIRAARPTSAVLRGFVVASVPAAAAGVWQIGRTLLDQPAAASTGLWPLAWLGRLGLVDGAPAPLAALAAGTLLLAPPLAVALALGRFWAELFARLRGRRLDPAWALAPWLFVLMLPAGMPLTHVAAGITFGTVVGCHAFGGTGRYLVNPALLGVVFLTVAYPASFGSGAWIPGTDLAPTWAGLAAAAPADSMPSWTDAVLGRQIGAFGTTSPAACLAGALLLALRGDASWRSLAGGLAGVALLGWSMAGLPWYWQPVLGSFAFVWAFVLTDPTTMALTRGGRWLQAGAFGALTVVLRTANPDHPESTAFALLLATLSTPLLDHVVVRRRVARLEKRREG